MEQPLMLEYKPTPHNYCPSRTEFGIIFDKLQRHYKLNRYHLEFRNLRGCLGKCFSYGKIVIRPTTNLGVLCHEVAHAIDFKRNGYHKYMRCHSRKHARLCKVVEDYCMKKNFWREEIARRTMPKAITGVTPQECKTEKIAKRQKDLLRYEKKLRYYTKLYSTKIRKAKRSISMLQRGLNP